MRTFFTFLAFSLATLILGITIPSAYADQGSRVDDDGDHWCEDKDAGYDTNGDGTCDGYYSGSATIPAGSTDCNDADKTVYPGATEVINGKDDDCDGITDETSPVSCSSSVSTSNGTVTCATNSASTGEQYTYQTLSQDGTWLVYQGYTPSTSSKLYQSKSQATATSIISSTTTSATIYDYPLFLSGTRMVYMKYDKTSDACTADGYSSASQCSILYTHDVNSADTSADKKIYGVSGSISSTKASADGSRIVFKISSSVIALEINSDGSLASTTIYTPDSDHSYYTPVITNGGTVYANVKTTSTGYYAITQLAITASSNQAISGTSSTTSKTLTSLSSDASRLSYYTAPSSSKKHLYHLDLSSYAISEVGSSTDTYSRYEGIAVPNTNTTVYVRCTYSSGYCSSAGYDLVAVTVSGSSFSAETVLAHSSLSITTSRPVVAAKSGLLAFDISQSTDSNGDGSSDTTYDDVVYFKGTDANSDGTADYVQDNGSRVDDDGDRWCEDKNAGYDTNGDGTCDGYYSGSATIPAGSTDCNDADKTVYPGATEACNSIDDDCDGQVDEGCTVAGDADGDGYTVEAGDCNDSDASIYPNSRAENCVNVGIDNDCDGDVNDIWEKADCDDDGWSTYDGDCDSSNGSVHPGATEACNSIDDDCDGQVDEGCSVSTPLVTDSDGDGYQSVASGGNDCDDANAAVHPGATEVCDSLDNNCDGQVDEGGVCTPPDTSSQGGDDSGGGSLDSGGDSSGGSTGTDSGSGSGSSDGSGSSSGSADGGSTSDSSGNEGNTSSSENVDESVDVSGMTPTPNVPGTAYYDDDSDGYCEIYATGSNCKGGGKDANGDGIVDTGTGGDCDDGNINTHPNAADCEKAGDASCDNVDNDCDGTVDHQSKTATLVTQSSTTEPAAQSSGGCSLAEIE